jgi:serine protease Do
LAGLLTCSLALCASSLIFATQLASAAQANPSSESPIPHSPFVKVAERVTPAVVAIRTVHSSSSDSSLREMFREFFPKGRDFHHPDFDVPGAGSGFVVSADGYIVTNNHVIENADNIHVKLAGVRQPLTAQIVGTDPATDLAVIKIQPDHDLQYLRFGDSEGIRVGDWAIAIGNPLGELEGSLTVGVISAKGRANLAIQGADMLRYQNFLQTDAAINPGNSGGPLVDISGDVIGVNTAINRAGQGIGFAIPARLTSYVYQQIRKFGRVRRGYLGITMAEIENLRQQGQKIPVDEGVVITDVLPDTPSARAGLKAGDVLTEYNGEPVEHIPALRFRVAESKVGSTARLRVIRDGKPLDFDVVLDEYDEAAALASAGTPNEQEPWLGFTAAPLNSSDPQVQTLKDEFDLGDQEGVVVVRVWKDSPADRARLRPGDVIVEFDGVPLDGSADSYAVFQTQLQVRQGAKDGSPIRLLVRRGDMNSYLEIDPKPSPEKAPEQP